jgi:hypothetical protein
MFEQTGNFVCQKERIERYDDTADAENGIVNGSKFGNVGGEEENVIAGF